MEDIDNKSITMCLDYGLTFDEFILIPTNSGKTLFVCPNCGHNKDNENFYKYHDKVDS